MAGKTFKLSGKPTGLTIGASIDVHKYKLQAGVLGRMDGQIRPLGEQVFANDEHGKKELCKYLAKYFPDEIVMEKTGVLSDPVYTTLMKFRGWKGKRPRVTVVKPDTVKRFPGEPHTDARSAYSLALLSLSGLINSIFIPTKEGKQLRQLTREAERLTKKSTALINEMKDILAGLGYSLPKFSLTATWGLDFLRLLLMEGIDGDIEKIYHLVETEGVNLHSLSKQAIMKRKTQYMRYAGLSIPRFDAKFLGRKLSALCHAEAMKESNTMHVESHVNEHPLLKEQVRRIEQVPGIGVAGATIIVAEVGDPSRFETARKLQLYAGRAVAPDASGEYVGRPRMTKRCNHRLKRVFRQAGITACFSMKDDNDVCYYAERQLKKHPHNPAIAAANTSAKIVKIVYKIMHDGVIYDPHHETRQGKSESLPGNMYQDGRWKAQLKDARRRANRFRNFTRRMLQDLPDGETRILFSRVMDVFNENSA